MKLPQEFYLCTLAIIIVLLSHRPPRKGIIKKFLRHHYEKKEANDYYNTYITFIGIYILSLVEVLDVYLKAKPGFRELADFRTLGL